MSTGSIKVVVSTECHKLSNQSPDGEVKLGHDIDMSDWRQRSEITGEVVLFRYAADEVELAAREVFIWDLDKTYLDTAFESLGGLWRTIVESSFQKRNVPGTAALLRAIRNFWRQGNPNNRGFPLYFVTASPPQMESRIHRKLNLDGIYPFGLFCKDNLKNLRPLKLAQLKQQIGFKLQALLQLRLHLSEEVRQVLWGDDSESDALIYSLYSDICARRLPEIEIRQTLKFLRVPQAQVDTILRLQEAIPVQDPVEKIYINLAIDTDADYYAKFGRRVVATYDSFQTALDLYQDQRLTEEQLVLVAIDLIKNYQFSNEELERSFDDLIRRPILARDTVERILPKLVAEGILSPAYRPSILPRGVLSRVGGRVLELEGNKEPWVPVEVDYLHDYR